MNIHPQATTRSDSVDHFVDFRSPIRTGFQTADELADLGRRLALRKNVELIGFFGLDFPKRLAENERAILQNYQAVAEASRRKQMITPAAEWLLDHHHTVRENFRQVRRDLPVKFFRQLPDIEVERGGRLPRMSGRAVSSINRTISRSNARSLMVSRLAFRGAYRNPPITRATGK